MFEINKMQFGSFVSAQRKAKGYTQKELAEKLFISDKAVSKWERGISLPDISLLVPLAGILDVTVMELLEGKRMENGLELNTDQVENLVKKALAYSDKIPEKSPQQRRKHWLVFGLCAAAVLLEWLACFLISQIFETVLFQETAFTLQILGLFFAAYFWIRAKEHLPAYFDENEISAYNDGFFEMNMPGISFNNRNWPYILRACRIWSVLCAAVFPVFCLFMGCFFPNLWQITGLFIMLGFCLGGLFLPVYRAARKYGGNES